MSTNDVPGANPSNHDQLGMGNWAEHKDGSLIFVESTEGNRVIYSVFDMSRDPPIEYRDAMPEVNFKKNYTWDPKVSSDKWTWHDKTPFPWDRIIKGGIKDGFRPAAAQHTVNAAQEIMESQNRFAKEATEDRTAAQRVADSLHLEGQEIDRSNIMHRVDQTMSAMSGVLSRLADAISNLPQGKKKKK